MTNSSSRKDGGWAWVVVFAAFMVNFLIDGVRYSFGIMIVEWHREFGGGMAEVSWIASLMFGLILIAAPIAAALVNRYGCRVIITIGTLTAFTGFIASVFAKNVLQMYFTFGVMGGVGFSMLFISSYVVVFQYFEKRRSLAIGLAVLGSGSGGLVFNPFSKWLLERYGWRGTILIESAILLNGVACGAVMRPMIVKDNFQRIDVNKQETQNLISHGLLNERTDTRVLTLDKNDEDGILLTGEGTLDTLHLPDSKTEAVTADENLSRSQTQKTNSLSADTEKALNTSNIKTGLLKIFRFDLLFNKRFLMMALMGFLINISYMVPFIYVYDMALKMGQPSDRAVWLMTSMSIANVVSRIPVGLIADIPRINTLYMMAVLLISSGVFTGIMPVCSSYEALLLVCILFSASIGMVLLPVVLSKLFGDAVIADAFGLTLLFGGLAGLIGPSLTGALFDKIHSYHTAFLTAGVEFILGGVVVCLIPCIGSAQKIVADVKG